MHTYVFKDIAVGGHLNSLEKYTVSLTIRIKLRISIYIYRSIAIGDEVPLAVCYTAHASSVYVIWYLPKWPVQQHGVNLIATKRMIGCFARIFVCGGKFWIPLEGELKAKLVQDCVLSRPSGLLFSIMSSIWIITDDILRSVLEIKRQKFIFIYYIILCDSFKNIKEIHKIECNKRNGDKNIL